MKTRKKRKTKKVENKTNETKESIKQHEGVKTTREKEILIFPTNYPNDTLNNKNQEKKTPHRCSDTRIQYLLVIFYPSYIIE